MATSVSAEAPSNVHKAIENVLQDEGFSVPSPIAAAAKETASLLLSYCNPPNFPTPFEDFSIELSTNLVKCFVQKRSHKQEKESMWGHYHMLRSSATFHESWIKFVREAVGRTPSPVFYQNVTHEVFKALLKLKYPICNSMNAKQMGITREEENALRYIAGYVCRKIMVRLESSSHPSKDDMIECIRSMSGDEMEERGTEDWTNLIDRGGLWHISDTTYSFFYSMEEEIRKYLTPSSAKSLKSCKDKMMQSIVRNEEVQFEWCMISTDTEEADNNELLNMIVELYVTIRGFSFASSVVELYKKRSKKTLQKGKGIRKELFTSSVN